MSQRQSEEISMLFYVFLSETARDSAEGEKDRCSELRAYAAIAAVLAWSDAIIASGSKRAQIIGRGRMYPVLPDIAP